MISKFGKPNAQSCMGTHVRTGARRHGHDQLQAQGSAPGAASDNDGHGAQVAASKHGPQWAAARTGSSGDISKEQEHQATTAGGYDSGRQQQRLSREAAAHLESSRSVAADG